MKKVKALNALLLAALLAATGLTASAQEDETVTESDEALFAEETDKEMSNEQLCEMLAQGKNRLGWKLLAMEAEKEENVFLSPYSIGTALSLLLQCSKEGPQADELRDLLSLTGISNEQLADAERYLMGELLISRTYNTQFSEEERAEFGIPELNIANAVFTDDELPPADSFEAFKTMLQQKYMAEFDVKDLSSEKALEEINDWVKEQTHEMIPTLLTEPLPESARLALMNALYFKGCWTVPFPEEATDKQPFHGLKGESEVDMMHVQDRFSYGENENYQIITLPYNYGFYMTVVLPKDPELVKTWKDADVLSALTDYDHYENADKEVILSMPKFKLEYDGDLKDLLEELGVQEIFTPNIYDQLSSDYPLFADKILHKTAITNSENGTEAAAVTAIIMLEGAFLEEPEEPVVMTIDRPFYFVITNADTNINLFEGCIFDLDGE